MPGVPVCFPVPTEELVNVPADCLCALTQEVMEDPVVCADGMSYERIYIQRWFNSGHATSPKTNLPLAHRTLIPNFALRGVIQELTNRMPLAQRQQLKIQRSKIDLDAVLEVVSENEKDVLAKLEEKRKCLILELESVQMALDDANARAASAVQLAKQAQRRLKEEIDAAEEEKQRRRVEIEAKFQVLMEATEQNRRTQQYLLEVRKKEVANVNARAKKYGDYAQKVQNSLKTALSEKSKDVASESARAESEFFLHHSD